MIIIAEWELEINGSVDGIRCFRVIAEEEAPCPCPACGGKLTKKGKRARFLIRTKKGATEDDYFPYEIICLIIQRRKCKKCGKIHHELPDCIVPYKLQSLEIIEEIINEPKKNTLIDEEIVKRLLTWWALMVAYILQVAPLINEKWQASTALEKNLAEIIRTLAHNHMWPGTRTKLTGAT